MSEKDESLHDAICDRMKEELEDVMTYHNLAEEQKKLGNHKAMELFAEISDEEYDHAKALCLYLESRGHVLSPEMEKMWISVNKIYEEY